MKFYKAMINFINVLIEPILEAILFELILLTLVRIQYVVIACSVCVCVCVCVYIQFPQVTGSQTFSGLSLLCKTYVL